MLSPNSQRSQKSGRAGIRALIAGLVLMAVAAGTAQATWTVESLIPDVLSIRVPSNTIGFELTTENYPPDQFPARYPATTLGGSYLPVQVFSNADGVWSLLLEVPDLVSESGDRVLSASQVMYRVNGGVWLRADGTPQVIYTQSGPTAGWLEVRVELALEITGTEAAGAYVINAYVSAYQEPSF